VDQLVVLGKSIGVPVLADELKPVELAKLSITSARQRALDVVIIDTAGRLHVDENLMDELAEIQKAVSPTEILFVADGMTGQDAVKSAQAFAQKLPVTGIVLTKMDGDARGGAALSVRAVTGCPIKFIASGEKPDALEAFHPDRMASRILGMGDIVTLVEKAQEAVDLEKAAEFGSKLKSGLDFDDLRDQLRQLKKMGPLGQLAQMIPGAGRLGDMNVDESRLAKVEAIIGSMTLEERSKPHLMNGSRRRRIALGSGTHVEDVNQLCRQLQMMQKMTRQMGKMGMKKMRRSMPIPF
jgi:signal recognition particle subunit SRP54